jgi:hypothetical protein
MPHLKSTALQGFRALWEAFSKVLETVDTEIFAKNRCKHWTNRHFRAFLENGSNRHKNRQKALPRKTLYALFTCISSAQFDTETKIRAAERRQIRTIQPLAHHAPQKTKFTRQSGVRLHECRSLLPIFLRSRGNRRTQIPPTRKPITHRARSRLHECRSLLCAFFRSTTKSKIRS